MTISMSLPQDRMLDGPAAFDPACFERSFRFESGARSTLAAVASDNQAMITIGARALASEHVYLRGGTYDVDDPHFQLIARPITIGQGAWIAADALVGPGASMGSGTELGARAVPFGRLEPDTVYVGNPVVPRRHRRPAASGERAAA